MFYKRIFFNFKIVWTVSYGNDEPAIYSFNQGNFPEQKITWDIYICTIRTYWTESSYSSWDRVLVRSGNIGLYNVLWDLKTERFVTKIILLAHSFVMGKKLQTKVEKGSEPSPSPSAGLYNITKITDIFKIKKN